MIKESRKIKFCVASILLSLFFNLTGGISVLAFGTDGDKDKKKDKNNVNQPQYETRVYIRRQCLISEDRDKNSQEAFGLLAIFLPLLINKALGGASSALKKAGSAQTLKDSGRLPTYLYQLSNKIVPGQPNEQKLSLNPNMGCLLVVRGTFSGVDPSDQSRVNFTGTDSRVLDAESDESSRITRLNNSNIPVTDIAVLYEAEIAISNDQTALNYKSRFLQVKSFQGGRSSDTRGLVMSIAINAPGAKEGEPTLSLALINLGNVKRGVMGQRQLYTKSSSWLGGLGISDDALKAIETIKLEDNQKQLGVMPVTFEATIAETDDGNKALLFIAEVLDATKDDVSKTVSDEILKDRGAEAKAKAKEATDAIEKLRQEEEEAYPSFLNAISELINAGINYPIPADNQPTITQQIKIAEVARTKRVWCGKYRALTMVGVSINRLHSEECQ